MLDYQFILERNVYAFAYNPVGFEVAFALDVFSDYLDAKDLHPEKWVIKQFKKNFDFEDKLMCKNTIDPKTLAARIYEATRLPNWEIDI